jgi:hypothetical protein
VTRTRRIWETFRELAVVHQNPELERLAQQIEERQAELTPEEEHAAINAAAAALKPKESAR